MKVFVHNIPSRNYNLLKNVMRMGREILVVLRLEMKKRLRKAWRARK